MNRPTDPRSPFHTTIARRRFVSATAGTALSATAVALLAGRPRLARGNGSEDDVRILATALAAEHEAVAAYQLGADSGLLSRPVLDLAVGFQGHHRAHAELLAGAIVKLGGTPPPAADHHDFPIERLRAEHDVLEFAAGLERGAVSAYAGAIPLFVDRELSRAAASILADEAMHWAVLRQALALDPVPGAFFS